MGTRLGSVALLVTLAGCGSGSDGGGGGGSFPPDATCGLVLEVSGGVSSTLTADTPVACATLLAFDAGFETDYIAAQGALRRVDLVVDDVTRGEIGSDYPAELTLTNENGTQWATPCTASVTRHDLVSGNDYKLIGNGSCDVPATSKSGAPDVDVGSFAFVTTVRWSP